LRVLQNETIRRSSLNELELKTITWGEVIVRLGEVMIGR